MKNKVLVTGGAGYIGSVLVEHLLDAKYKVTVIDNFRYRQNSLGHLYVNKNLKIFNIDVLNFDYYKSHLDNHEIIIPLAALVGAPLCRYQPELSKLINCDVIKKLIDYCGNKKKIIMPTTNSAYGSGNKNNFCDENSKLKPISEYAIDKVELEKYLMKNSNSISLRLATVFGSSPRMRTDLLVNDFVYRAMIDKSLVLFEPNFKRNYIHIQDVARAFLHSINNWQVMKNQIFNLGLEDANLSKLELCEKIKKHLSNFEFFTSKNGKDPDQRNYIVSNKKILSTGFKTKFTVDDGIQELIKCYTFIRTNDYSNI